MKKQRLESIEKEIVKAASEILLEEVKNPKIKGVVSVTKAVVTDDLKYADLYFSILPPLDSEEKEASKEDIAMALEEIKGFLRKKIAGKMELRIIPEIRVKLDDSIAYSAKINELLDSLKK